MWMSIAIFIHRAPSGNEWHAMTVGGEQVFAAGYRDRELITSRTDWNGGIGDEPVGPCRGLSNATSGFVMGGQRPPLQTAFAASTCRAAHSCAAKPLTSRLRRAGLRLPPDGGIGLQLDHPRRRGGLFAALKPTQIVSLAGIGLAYGAFRLRKLRRDRGTSEAAKA
jgi:hypothetical protein